MGLLKWAATRVGKRKRKQADRAQYDPAPARIRFKRDGTRMTRMARKNTGTGTGYRKAVAAKKVAPALSLAVFNSCVGFMRGFKPEWMWDESQDAEVLVMANGILAGVWAVWVYAWDLKRAWWDKLGKSKLPG